MLLFSTHRFSDRQFQQGGGFNTKNGGKLADDLKARIADALFQLADIGAVNVRFIGQILLGQALGMPKAAQIGRKSLK